MVKIEQMDSEFHLFYANNNGRDLALFSFFTIFAVFKK